jgi:DNA helicase-2/ATP-dependent DNA helicase PcrA
MPAFTVFSNKTLKAIAILKPGSMAELGRIKGIGPAKLDAYGADILRMLRR